MYGRIELVESPAYKMLYAGDFSVAPMDTGTSTIAVFYEIIPFYTS